MWAGLSLALFYFLHSALASNSAKAWWAGRFPRLAKYYRLLYNLVAVVTLGAVGLLYLALPNPQLYQVPLGLKLLAYGLMASGLWLGKVAFGGYRLGEFVGLEALREKAGAKPETLSRQGPSNWVRHPLYSATLLLVVPWFLQNGSLNAWALGWVTMAYLPIGIRLEEQKLLQEFGEAYQAYRRSVPYRLIPQLW